MSNLQQVSKSTPYSNFDNYSQQQDPPQVNIQYPNIAKPQNQDQTNPIFFPIVQQPQQQQHPQQGYSLQYPMMKYELKLLPFSQQKEFLTTMLCMIAIQQFLGLFFLGLMGFVFQMIHRQAAYIMFPISLIGLGATLRFSVQSSQNSCGLFTLAAQLTAQSFAFLCFCFDNTRYPGDNFIITPANLVLIGCLFQIVLNLIMTLIVMCQLRATKERISFIPILSVLIIISLPLSVALWPFVFNCTATIIFVALLINSLNQISQGRFSLTTDQVFKNANAVCFGMIFPIWKQ